MAVDLLVSGAACPLYVYALTARVCNTDKQASQDSKKKAQPPRNKYDVTVRLGQGVMIVAKSQMSDARC